MDEEISTIVRSTIDLGHNLGLKVVAEGVENLSVWNALRKLGCDDAQGFFMSKPLDPRTLAYWIRANDGRFPCPVSAGGGASDPSDAAANANR